MGDCTDDSRAVVEPFVDNAEPFVETVQAVRRDDAEPFIRTIVWATVWAVVKPS